MPSLQQTLLQNLGLCGGWDRQDSNSYSHQGYIPEGKINKQEVRAPDKFRPEMLQGNKADGKMKWDVGGERTTSLSVSRRHSLTKVRLRAANPTDARVSTSFSVSLVVPFHLPNSKVEASQSSVLRFFFLTNTLYLLPWSSQPASWLPLPFLCI